MAGGKEIPIEGGEVKRQIKTGLLIIVVGIGIPIVSFFFQTEDLVFKLGSPTYKEIERKLTPDEIKAIEEDRVKTLERMRENEIKARKAYRHEEAKWIRWMIEVFEREHTLFGEDYYKETWIIKSKAKLVIPYKYFLGIGFILIFVGIGKIVLSIPSREKKLTKEMMEHKKKSEEDK